MFEEIVQTAPQQESGLMRTGIRGDNSPSDIMHLLHFKLRSKSQPDVLRMTCRGVLDEPWEAVPPTIAEIRKALRGIVVLELAKQ
jgi:hypothetical protein